MKLNYDLLLGYQITYILILHLNTKDIKKTQIGNYQNLYLYIIITVKEIHSSRQYNMRQNQTYIDLTY